MEALLTVIRFLWKRSHPRWFHEFTRGDIKSRLGHKKGDPDFVIEFLIRKKFGVWKPFAKFRFVDIPTVEQHFREAQEALRKLFTE